MNRRSFGTSVLLLLGGALYGCGSGASSHVAPDSESTTRAARGEAAQRALKHLALANQECTKREDAACQQIHRFFVQAKRGAPAFADDALCFSSKWKLVWDYVPWTSHESSKRYLRDQFAAHVFSEADLKQTIERAIRGYLGDMGDVESEMLVNMRIDMKHLPPSALPELATPDQFEAAFKKAIEQAQSRVGDAATSDIETMIVAELATRITMQVLDAVAADLAVEGGLLGAGGASGWETLGVGLVVFWIVDEVWDWMGISTISRTLSSTATESRVAFEDNLIGLPGSGTCCGGKRSKRYFRPVKE
jgi:hypothetical protein